MGTDQRGVRAQALGRQLEGGPGAGAGFVEEQRDPPMGQPLRARRRLLRFELGGQAQDGGNIVHPQRGNGKQRPRADGKREARPGVAP